MACDCRYADLLHDLVQAIDVTATPTAPTRHCAALVSGIVQNSIPANQAYCKLWVWTGIVNINCCKDCIVTSLLGLNCIVDIMHLVARTITCVMATIGTTKESP